ncbi:MAG: hypothetical protein JWQ34_2724 [Mucilaginibacter sp.]|uniref:YciE/YciF ferroxidase family protein n=1 Tax=Mucilaginibacter sp. TaxID=1882438 RepID=UPI00262E1838|nr:DUF892 family protein [Mucilaginibacter sp.]MDB5004499.1 hypothetical protein [Mucilaginibacter sp.]
MKKEDIHLGDITCILFGEAPPVFLLEVFIRTLIGLCFPAVYPALAGQEDERAADHYGLIFAGQKAEHYEIASYGGMISLAKTLGYYEIAEPLVLTIDEEKTADALLTRIAENHVNYEASTETAD